MKTAERIVQAAGAIFLLGALVTGAGCHSWKGSPRPQRSLASLQSDAVNGDPQAQFELAELYANGDGVPRNYGEAFRWYRASAERGHANAQFNVGVMFKDGRVVRRDNVQAYKWLNLSAARGNRTAVLSLDSLTRTMSRDQIVEAQRQAAAFVPRTGPLTSQESPPGTVP